MSDNVFLATDGVRNRPNLHLPKATINGRKGADCSRGGREEYLLMDVNCSQAQAGRQAAGALLTQARRMGTLILRLYVVHCSESGSSVVPELVS